MGLENFLMTFTHHYSIRQCFYYPKTPLCLTYLSLSLSTPGNYWPYLFIYRYFSPKDAYWFYIVFNIYCIFYHYHLLPLYPLSHSTHHTAAHVDESFFLFCSIPPYPNLPTLLAVIFSPSMSLSLFCLLVQFVHYIPNMSEIIWYLSFSDWFISLSIIFSRSTHTITKGKIFIFFTTA